MIQGQIDLRSISRQLAWLASDFGEENKDGIIRWGVATARRLAIDTQAFGEGTGPRAVQENAIMKDAHKAVIVVNGSQAQRKLMKHRLTFLRIGGQGVTFSASQNITTAAGVNAFLDSNRGGRGNRVRAVPVANRILTTQKVFRSAMIVRKRRAGKAKGAWIGAGKALARFAKRGKRINIGKNFLSYAHKFSSGGSATFRPSMWSPVGTISSHVPQAGDRYVIPSADLAQAAQHSAHKVIAEYTEMMNRRRNRRRR